MIQYYFSHLQNDIHWSNLHVYNWKLKNGNKYLSILTLAVLQEFYTNDTKDTVLCKVYYTNKNLQGFHANGSSINSVALEYIKRISYNFKYFRYKYFLYSWTRKSIQH